MPPSTSFTKAMLVEAATELVRDQGIAALSARAVGNRLGCSTAPIYANFASVEELRATVIDEVRARLRKNTTRPYTERPFLNLGTGLVAFARDEPRLFQLLFLVPEVAGETVPRVHADLLDGMKRDARFATLGKRERSTVLEKLWYMAMGMATLAYSGQLRAASDAQISAALLEAGGVLIPQALGRLPKKRKRAGP